MCDDERLAVILTECLAELQTDTVEGRAGVLTLLRQIEDISPGEVRAMSQRLQLHRMSAGTAH